MGLKEKRIIKAFENDLYPALEADIYAAAGHNIAIEIQWDTLQEDRFSHLYNDTFPKIYFLPLIEAFKAICVDDMGVDLLKAGLKKVTIINENDHHNEEHAITFEDGLLKIDHSPVINADKVEDRTARIVALLEDKLETFAENGNSSTSTASAESTENETTASTQEKTIDINEMYNRSFVTSIEKQEIFKEMVAGLDWSCDMAEGKLTFGEDKVFDIQIFGTYSENEKSWLWAWANTQSGISETFLQTSLAVKAFGKALNISDFTTPKFAVESDPGAFFATIATASIGESCYVPLAFKGVIVYVTIKSEEADSKAKNTADSICSHISKVTSEYTFPHKFSLYFYLTAKGYDVELPGNNLVAKKGDDQILGIFDLKGTLMKISNTNLLTQA
ncbi:DUF6882 domain-containing protein [Maribacter forsetii]|uniref:DUF6882 domain-containing protein n=1 Tax=Maribacter forsetii TaxID=444515 RepID=UPI000AC75C45|nr:DUF6882 domain-containing protein [Maribacter forsetii]